MVLGRLKDPEDGVAALRLAARCHWPVFADINAQICPSDAPGVLIDAYDACLEDTLFADAHAPEAVLYLGAPGVSKTLTQFLARCAPRPFVVVHETPNRQDPGHQVSHRLQQNVASACRAWESALEDTENFDETWLQAWQRANKHVRQSLRSALTGAGPLSEPFVAYAVTSLLPKDHGLIVGNSMPVRDVNRFGSFSRTCLRVIANRGVSGIDGTIATAAGAARGWQIPVTVILGDLAMLHDLNSLAIVRELPVTIVVLNNDGGGIFHMLDVSVSPKTFERAFGTPHGLHFAHAAQLFGLNYARVSTREQFKVVYSGACSGDEPTIIEVCTDRAENHVLHRALAERAAAAVRNETNNHMQNDET